MKVARGLRYGFNSTLVSLFLVALMIASAWIGLLAYGASQLGPASRGAFVADYDGRLLDDGLELLLVQSDGQAFATLARDPWLQRPESFGSLEEASYRAQRPLLGWMAALLSLGYSGWVPPALAFIAAVGTAAAVAGAGVLIRRGGRSPWWALSLLLLPGTGTTLSYLGPEPMVLGFLLWGVVAWEGRRFWPAVALFAVAALGRETACLVPAALGMIAISRRQWLVASRLLVVPAVMAAWYVVLQARVGTWPWEASEGRLRPPFVGLWIAVDEIWADPALQGLYLSLPIIAVVAAMVLARRDHLIVIVAIHALFAMLMGEYVWAEVDFYGRVLLPMYAFALIAIVRSFDRKLAQTPMEPVHGVQANV